MKNDEINRTIKECFKSLDYRDNEIAKLNFNNLSLIDKNIEILENISFSLSESSLKLSFISKEIPEHSEMQETIKKIITVLNDGVRACNETLRALNQSNQLIQIINKMKY